MTFEEMRAILTQPSQQTGGNKVVAGFTVEKNDIFVPRVLLDAVCLELQGRLEMVSAGIVQPSHMDRFCFTMLAALVGQDVIEQPKEIGTPGKKAGAK